MTMQDTEVNQQYLEKLLFELDTSPVAPPTDGESSDEESSENKPEEEEKEGDSGDESSDDETSKEEEEPSEGDSDDLDGSPLSSSDEEEEPEAEGDEAGQSSAPDGSQALVATGPAESGEVKPGQSLALVAVGAESATAGKANSVVAASQGVGEGGGFKCGNQCKSKVQATRKSGIRLPGSATTKKMFPIELSDYYEKSKTDMFNLWLQNGKDLQKQSPQMLHWEAIVCCVHSFIDRFSDAQDQSECGAHTGEEDHGELGSYWHEEERHHQPLPLPR